MSKFTNIKSLTIEDRKEDFSLRFDHLRFSQKTLNQQTRNDFIISRREKKNQVFMNNIGKIGCKLVHSSLKVYGLIETMCSEIEVVIMNKHCVASILKNDVHYLTTKRYKHLLLSTKSLRFKLIWLCKTDFRSITSVTYWNIYDTVA